MSRPLSMPENNRPPVAHPASRTPASATGLPPRLAAVLAYSAWWISGLLLWWLERQDGFVRFHAAQSVAAFGLVSVVVGAFAALAILSLALLPDAFLAFLWAAGLTWVAGELLWLAAIWRAAHGQAWRMPLVGGIAERWARVESPDRE